MSAWNTSSEVAEGEPGSGTTPEQPDAASVSEVIDGSVPSPVPPTEEPAVSAPDLTKEEQQDVGEVDPDSPSVKDDDVKLAAQAKADDDAWRLENPNAPLIRSGNPSVGGEHFY